MCLQFLKLTHLHPFLPTDPQIPPCEETGYRMSPHLVDPTLLPQLGHDGINPGEASVPRGPLCQGLGILVPRDLDTDRVPVHPVKVWVLCCRRIEEVPPEELAKQRKGRFFFLDLAKK